MAFWAVAAPAHEQLQHPRSSDRIALINRHQLLCHPLVAAAIGAMEMFGAAAKATRYSEVVVTDGQASSSQEEIKNLVDGADVIILPTAAQTRSLELTLEMAEHLKQFNVPFAALLVKVDSRKAKAAREIRQALEASGISVLRTQIPLLAAFEKAENAGVTVDQAVSAAGKSDPRRMIGWHAYTKACEEIAELVPQRANVIPMHPIGWDTTPLEQRRAA